MKKQNFLSKLRREGKLELIESSEEMKASYLEKADNCLRSAKILFQNKLYENSVSEAYYSMYNSLLALLFKAGIKSENHSASIIILKNLFNAQELYKLISFAKEERIDKQYYVESKQTFTLTENSCREMIVKVEDFLVKIRLLISRLSNDDIKSIRVNFEKSFMRDNL
jgi:uncharacterized protein (UPF0332 family)